MQPVREDDQLSLTIAETSGVRYLEGPPEAPLLRHVDDARLLVEACFSNRVRAVLLYAPNMTVDFFDLSSGEAGAVVQTLRNYRMRLAVVCPPGTVQFSSMFGEMVREEQTGEFGIFESGVTAREWVAHAGLR